jgi:HD-like signal output (HDOD) protein
MSSEVPTNSDVASIIATLPYGATLLGDLATLLSTDVDLDDVVALIARDSKVTDDIVAAANHFGGEEPVETLEPAIARLGERETLHFAGAFAWRELSPGPLRLYNVSADALWRSSVFTGLLMQELAPAAGVSSALAFLAGLLRSVGKVVLDELARRTAEIPPYTPGPENLAEWEESMLGYTNVEVAAAAFEVWRFPLEIGTAVRCHYAPSDNVRPMAQLLNLAAGTADLRGFGITGEEEFWHFSPATMAACNLDRETISAAEAKAAVTLQRIAGACRAPVRGAAR